MRLERKDANCMLWLHLCSFYQLGVTKTPWTRLRKIVLRDLRAFLLRCLPILMWTVLPVGLYELKMLMPRVILGRVGLNIKPFVGQKIVALSVICKWIVTQG